MSASGICCCGITLKTGAKTLVVIFISLDLIYMGVLTIRFIQDLTVYDNPSEPLGLLLSTTIPPSTDTSWVRMILLGLFLSSLLFVFLDFGMNILLWSGASSGEHRKCQLYKAWMFFVIILTGCRFIFGLFLQALSIIDGIVIVFQVLLNIYAVTLVSCLIIDIKDYPWEYIQPITID